MQMPLNPMQLLPQTNQQAKNPNKKVISGGWFEPNGHRYYDSDGHRILSVTQIFQLLGLVDYNGVDPAVLEHKSEIGVAVHKSVELLLQNALDWDTVDEAAMPYVVSAEVWFHEMQFELLATEQQGILETHGMKIGYQYDQWGTILYQGHRRQVIVDLKTTSKKSPTWALQTAAYALTIPVKNGEERPLRVVLHLQKNGRAKPIFYENPQDEEAFLYMAYCAIWKLNAGYKLAA
jgi:hypothetical protein